MTERLIVFTRYPEPGTTKTRLIPALGAEGAAALQRQMTEHTLEQIQQIQRLRDRPCAIEIRFTGGDTPAQTTHKQRLMQRWLGSALIYQPQATGDLGVRMAQAFAAAFSEGIERIVTIGTDCPSLDAKILTQAFEALHHHDLVLGPATDGGYYLIGLSRFIPELFEGIRWGTDEVLQRTVEISERLGLTVADLPPLTDIDRPEDLAIWEDICTKKSLIL